MFIRNGGLANIQVPSSLIKSSQNPRQRYKSYLVEKRRFEEEEKEKNDLLILNKKKMKKQTN